MTDFGQQVQTYFNRSQFKSNAAVRIRIWRKLAHLLNDGISLIESLRLIRKAMASKSAGYAALTAWIKGIENGRNLGESVQDWVLSEEYMLIVSGESSGTLPGSMHSIVKGMRAKSQIRAAIFGGIAYPFFLVLLAFAFLWLLGFKLVPAFTSAVQKDQVEWFGFAKVVINLSDFIQTWLPSMAGVLAVLIILFFVSLPIWNSGLRTFFDRYPPFAIYRILQGATWLIGMSALIQSGVRIERALELTASSATPWAKARVLGALRGLRAGRSFGEALQETGYEFPSRDVVSDIVVYSGHKGMDEALRKIADEWLEESVEQIQSMMKVLFSVSLVFVGCTVLLTVLGVMDLQQQLSALLEQRR
jgi:type II secretory pathway component PulF